MQFKTDPSTQSDESSFLGILRGLNVDAMDQLLRLLDPGHLGRAVDGEALVEDLRLALRRSLEVPASADLGEYLRRRLVETVVYDFGIGTRTDLATDLELAGVLINFVLDSAKELAEDADARTTFESFIRTKDRSDRIRWLVSSRELAAHATDEAWNAAAARSEAEQIQDEKSAHRLTAKALLDELATVWTANRGIAGSAAGASAAMPLSAVAGSLFMSGPPSSVDEPAQDTKSDARARRQRARRSTLVQTVVILSAFVLSFATPSHLNEPRTGDSEHHG